MSKETLIGRFLPIIGATGATMVGADGYRR